MDVFVTLALDPAVRLLFTVVAVPLMVVLAFILFVQAPVTAVKSAYNFAYYALVVAIAAAVILWFVSSMEPLDTSADLFDFILGIPGYVVDSIIS